MAEKEFTDVQFSTPDVKKIQCKDCVFRYPDVKVCGTTIKGSVKGLCEVFDTLPGKPFDVLWENAECPYYVGEDESDED